MNIKMQGQDVRRPKNIHPYPAAKQVEGDDGGSSIYQFLSLAFGMLAFIFKVYSNLEGVDEMGLLVRARDGPGVAHQHALPHRLQAGPHQRRVRFPSSHRVVLVSFLSTFCFSFILAR